MAVAELAPFDDTLHLQSLHGPIDGREGDVQISLHNATMQLGDSGWSWVSEST